jgi:hypothetical protein
MQALARRPRDGREICSIAFACRTFAVSETCFLYRTKLFSHRPARPTHCRKHRGGTAIRHEMAIGPQSRTYTFSPVGQKKGRHGENDLMREVVRAVRDRAKKFLFQTVEAYACPSGMIHQKSWTRSRHILIISSQAATACPYA